MTSSSGCATPGSTAPIPAEQAKLAEAMQVEAFKSLPYIPLGATVAKVAYSKKLTGMYPAPVACYWGIGKTA